MMQAWEISFSCWYKIYLQRPFWQCYYHWFKISSIHFASKFPFDFIFKKMQKILDHSRTRFTLFCVAKQFPYLNKNSFHTLFGERFLYYAQAARSFLMMLMINLEERSLWKNY